MRTPRTFAACMGHLLAATALMIVNAGSARAGLVGIASTATLWDINPSTGVPTNPRSFSTAPDNSPLAIAVAPFGKLYGVPQGMGSHLFIIDPATGAPTLGPPLTQFIFVEGDIATDPTSGLLYAVEGTGALFRIDTSSGVCTSIGTLSGSIDLSAMAFDNTGNLFIFEAFHHEMYRVDKTNATVISSVVLTPSPGARVAGMAFDPGNGTAYLAADIGSSARFSIVDPNTGAVTSISSLAATGGIWGLAFIPEPTPTQKTSWGRVKALYR